MLSRVRRGGPRHLGYHASILAVNAVVSASLLLGLAGKDALNPGDQYAPDRAPGYGPRQYRVAVQSYQDNQSASLNWTLRGQDAVNPGEQRFPDRYPGTLPTQHRLAVTSYEDVQNTSLALISGVGSMTLAPGRVTFPTR